MINTTKQLISIKIEHNHRKPTKKDENNRKCRQNFTHQIDIRPRHIVWQRNELHPTIIDHRPTGFVTIYHENEEKKKTNTHKSMKLCQIKSIFSSLIMCREKMLTI